jgi:hypothetical protein
MILAETAFAWPMLLYALAILSGVPPHDLLVPFLIAQFIGCCAEGASIWWRFHR